MVIIKYDTQSITPHQLKTLYDDVVLSLEDTNEKVICIPLEIEVLRSCSLETLRTVRDEIQEAIDYIEDELP